MKPVARKSSSPPPGSDADTPPNGQSNNKKPADPEDPWAGYNINTQTDGLDEEEEDEDAWLQGLPLSPEVLQNMPSKKEVRPPMPLQEDSFYDPFDEDKFAAMQKEYSAQVLPTTTPFSDSSSTSPNNSTSSSSSSSSSTLYDEAVQQSREALQPRRSRWTTAAEHVQHQQRVFDEMSDFFVSTKAIPPELVPVYKFLAQRILKALIKERQDGQQRRRTRQSTSAAAAEETSTLEEKDRADNTYRLLDVGCGTGAMFEYYLQAAQAQNVQLHITGLDLSPRMVQLARIKAEQILDEVGGRHQIRVVTADIIHYGRQEAQVDPEVVRLDDEVAKVDDGPILPYDGIIMNACFGNFWDQAAVLQHVTSAQLLVLDGLVFVTHPLGGDFVRKLNREDPDTVPHVLPSIVDYRNMTRCLPVQITDFVEQVDLLNAQKQIQSCPVYYSAAIRVPHRALEQVIRLRGPVDTGYGRGGKKLGFPTANLPSSLFKDALDEVPTGVYFGWAVIEDPTGRKKGRNTYHKAVVNVGYSPTFQGQENRIKIVEAHLMIDEEVVRMVPSDFYNETLRLQLHGYLRPERKFPSFPDLIAQIKTDVLDAKDALGMQPFAALRSDVFLVDPCRRINNTMLTEGKIWIGKDGGDATASWEFQDIQSALQQLPLGKWVA